VRNEELAIIAAKRVEAETEDGVSIVTKRGSWGIHIEKGSIMSTDYILSKKVRASDLLCGRLARFGIQEHVTSGAIANLRAWLDGLNIACSPINRPEDLLQDPHVHSLERFSRCLSDGRDCLWVYLTEDGFVASLSRYGANAPDKILAAISEEFETDVFSEYEPQYWGFDTQEELDAAWKKWADQDRDRFYADLCAYIRGEPNDIRPGTIGEIKAKIAKTLVESQAALVRPENKDTLLSEMDAIYDRDHAVIITLGPEDIALAEMLAAHEDDLPKA
jgi:hypothetical protein